MKVYRYLFLLILEVLVCHHLGAQKQGNIWYFGNKAGLDFKGYFPMPLTDGQIESQGGTAAICDTAGQLLFYTDGKTVWNRHHQVMSGGSNLNGDPRATHAATIVPSPSKTGQYCIFTTRRYDQADPDNYGGNYYIVDFNNNSLGEVIYDFSAVNGQGGILRNSTEKLTVIPVRNEQAYFILMHEFNTNRFALFKLDSTVHFVKYQSIGTEHKNGTGDDGSNRGGSGQIKVSAQLNRIVLAIEGQLCFEVFNFNNQTGTLSSARKLPAWDGTDKYTPRFGAYGIDLAPSGEFLYGSTRDGGMVYQWDMLSSDMVKTCQLLYSNPEVECGAVQTAPNGKIYIALNNRDFMRAIDVPNRYICNFIPEGIRLIDNETGLGGMGTYGLPVTLPQYLQPAPFFFENTCLGDTTIFYLTNNTGVTRVVYAITNLATGTSVTINGSTYLGTLHEFKEAGQYRVRMDLLVNGTQKQYTRDISINPEPDVKLAETDRTTMCRNAQLELDAGLGAFYEWEDVTIKDRRRTITNDDIPGLLNEFRVKVTDYHGCIGWDTLWIEPKNPPSLNEIRTVSSFCNEPNGSATVVPSGNLSDFLFRWDHDTTITGNTISGMPGGTYRVTVKSKIPPGCSNSFEVVIPRLGGESVEIEASGDNPVCPNAPLVLKAINCQNAVWINPPGDTSLQITVYPAENTVYKVTGINRDTNGRICETIAEFPVTVRHTVKPDLGADREDCEGTTITLDGGGGYTQWNWSNGMSGRTIGLTEKTDNLVLYATDSNKCISTDTVNVRFLPAPEVIITTAKATCGESNGTATVTPVIGQPSDYLYIWESFPDVTGNSLTGIPGGEYRVTVASKATGCKSTFELTVNVLGGRQVEISSSATEPVCPGTPVTLTASNCDGYEWINPPGPTAPQITVHPLEETVYKVKGITRDEEGNECPTYGVFTVKIFPYNKPDLGEDRTSCQGDTIEIEADPGYLAIHWSNGSSGRRIFLTESLSDLVLTVEDENRCTFSDTINIGFNPLPEVNLGNDQTLCTNTPLTLAGGAGDSYLWNTGESTGTIAAVESGKYWLTIQKDGCANTDSVNIRIYNPDRFSVNATEIHDVTCFGSGNGSLLVLADGPAGSFLYSVDGGDSFIDNNGRFENLMPSDDYRIQVLADSVCRISAPGPVTISEPDEIRVRHRVRLAGCKECSDGIIELTEITGGTPPFEIAWDNMQSGPIAEGLTPGEYQAVITDANGCAKTVSYEIVVQTDVPNAFTPNGDGVNDRWFIRFLDFYPEAVVKVFDSFGKIVFIRENGYTEPWDGTSGGQPLPMGAYYYYIYLTPRDIPLKGSLTLIR